MENAEGGPVRLPQLRLDELLEELQARVDAARGTRDRVHSLLEAVLSVGRELDLEHVLRRIVEAAVLLVDAQYGALGVIGPDGKTLCQFLTVGLTEEEIKAIGPYPSGHGILGELIRHPEPLRLAKLSEHPSSYGFPPNHPPMNSFVGVPIRVREHVFGNLYLTEKRGEGDFDAEDEAVLSTLAVAAGVAIDNARLYEEAMRREKWLRASGRVTTSLMSGSPLVEVTGLIAETAKDITGAELAAVALPLPDATALTVEFAAGRQADAHRGLVLPVEGSLVGLAYHAADPVFSEDVTRDPRISAGPPRFAGLGPAVAVPIKSGQAVRGVLLLVRAPGRPMFSEEEIEPLLGFAGQAALAMELGERRSDAEQIALLEDHDRIARDLHDLAIQRLFATGMTLQSADRLIDHPGASERVQRAVNDLDETIKIIRSTIFGLRARETASQHGLRTRAVQAVGEAASVLGFAPSLRMEGLLDTQVPKEVAADVVAVLGEALSNVARHAHAGRADVALVNDGKSLVVTVTDNGVGVPSGGRRSGLRNLSERAERQGGEMALTVPPGGGTTLTWRVPLPAP
ncbi:sensor histidine kinase [Wenjunlia tyrosinilytica]|uniref:Histidine kinase n=1 Tax=Wenjunlia tyrosinilytica TaxID=1544741 RepID=A0A917ZR11_9ACTN|nr:GAF domain-containing protein [Wenjunlia tyrosinilytica]GGO90464.1 histidine kinase [Wenjunlia tyrosinilytica]